MEENNQLTVPHSSLAIRYDPTNVRYLWERSNLHMRLGEQKHCMDGYRRILSLLPLEQGEHFMQLSKDMAKYGTHIHTHTYTCRTVSFIRATFQR